MGVRLTPRGDERADRLFTSTSVSVVRLNGRAREAVTGSHRRALVYVAADVSVRETVRLLRETAEELARRLPA